MDIDTQLDRVIACQVNAERARAEFVEAVRAAVASGVTRLQIAEATKISRTTLWRWLKASGEAE